MRYSLTQTPPVSINATGEMRCTDAVVAIIVLLLACGSLLQLIMDTTVHGGRSASSSSSAASSAEGHDTLEQLSASALQELLKLADATQQLAALFELLPLEDGSLPPQQQQQQGDVADDGQRPAPVDAGAAVVAAVMPRLPQLTACIDKLMLNSCFKEAQTCVECLVLLGRQLHSPSPAAAGAPRQQQQQLPAHAALSRWAAESALQQDEPEVKSVSLAKALLDVYIRFCGERGHNSGSDAVGGAVAVVQRRVEPLPACLTWLWFCCCCTAVYSCSGCSCRWLLS